MAVWRRIAPAALKTALKWALVAVILYFLIRNIPIKPAELGSFLYHANARFYASLLIFSLFLMMQAGIWVLIVRATMARDEASGQSAAPRLRMGTGLTIFIDSQFAKYIPGGIWNYAGRIVLAGREGISFEALTASVIYETVLLVAAAFLYALLLLAMLGSVPLIPLILGTAAVLGLAYAYYPRLASVVGKGFAFASRRGPAKKLIQRFNRPADGEGLGPAIAIMPRRRFFGCLLLFLFSHFIMGIAFWMMVGSFDRGQIGLFYAAGTFAASWLIGLLSPLPGGLGVREGFLVYFLSLKIDSNAALHISVIARLWNVMAEVLFWVILHAVRFPFRKRNKPERGQEPNA
ncbi:lysylphosphatidylglycerol synthase domain-containing protein [Cohnella thailandensis]|uniref:Phosphatidylglycerol lysyltransferase n=1 Tax=Cohnella thailandensis TaxID=557557 RepID=A0A841SSC2_9BACL|nr:lysylphosphatidylglycerol synthase domain-containing protein [Cohnella thailandensis]MBB6633108.1 flippase-like domain-containing protein [Cohnella thailandensis]MBP1975197.1 uncharacterized membrane protein YbhN (UPF0104 family) [Cohnella thailandensis]